ncbi:MAG TPA: PEP/pyruvate-binding domain-containing protein [Acidimicrobiales bacterium]|nr:PEP/pyruvate-binding domain-containing protein [Acidimicrobiales bacterium]
MNTTTITPARVGDQPERRRDPSAASAREPQVGRAALWGAAIGFGVVTVAVTFAMASGSDAGAAGALGMGLFIGIWGGCGFGGMLGATLCLARTESLPNVAAPSDGKDATGDPRRLAAVPSGRGGARRLALWQPLDGRGAMPSVVGGKAAALDRLVEHGVPVPTAAALTVEAYRAFVEGADLVPLLEGLPSKAEPTALRGGADGIVGAFLGGPLPAGVSQAIADAYAHAANGGLVAVRSSAVAEDLVSASFAGQYHSFLGVGPDGLERAIRLCWASLWAPGARAYRHAHGFDSSDLAMGIVIQAMVDADRSGVVFTVDPTSSDPGLVRVEVVEGLGERLVSGLVTPEVFHVRRSDLAVREEDAPPFVAEVARRALEIEARLGGAQDIEWSLAGGRLHILQARPVTAGPSPGGDGFDASPTPGATFTSAGVGEMLPGVLPPLLWTVNGPMLNDAFAALFETLSIPLDGPMVVRVRGRAALNLSLLKAAARRMPRGSEAEVERQYLGRVVSDSGAEPPLRVHERLHRVRPALRALRLRRRLLRDAEVFVEAADLAVGLDPDLSGASTTSLVAYRHRLRELARRGVRTEVAVAATAAANYRGLEVVLERWLGPDDGPLAAQRLTAGRVGEQAGGCAALLSLWDVHCDYCQLPEVTRAVYEGPVDHTAQRLARLGETGVAFLQIVDAGLRLAGSAAVYSGPTWEEDPGSFWSLLRQCRGLLPEASPSATMAQAAAEGAAFADELYRRLTRSWKWRRTRILTGQIVDVRRRLLRAMVADAATYLRLREATKSAMLRLGGAERRVVSELSRRLVAEGALEREGAEWFLSDEELDDLALGRGGPGPETIERRRVAWEAARRAPALPEVFSGFPVPEPESPMAAGAGVIQGWAASPGRVTGRARVVADAAEARDVTGGEILVGRSTDPSWTPLFLTVAGIVMEEGGPLSHAAIVAREFRLPAVLNAKGATTRIRTGMRITVDGTRGTVEICEQAHVGEAA